MDPVKRAKYCADNLLCFVSLKPLVDGMNGNMIIRHPQAGNVAVNQDMIKCEIDARLTPVP